MFYNGIGPSPTPIPTEYNLSTGCTSDAIIPTSAIEVGDITLCDTSYSIDAVFANQNLLVNFLNDVFLESFGLPGSFYIDENNHLIYMSSDTCVGVNCIELYDSIITEDGINIITEDGDLIITE